MTKTPWAILLCKFNDNATEPFGGGKTFYEEMFTSAARGSTTWSTTSATCRMGTWI